MHDDHALAAWGQGILEEALLRAALTMPGDGDAEAGAACTLPFRITADATARQLELRCPRVGGEDLVLRVDLPLTESG